MARGIFCTLQNDDNSHVFEADPIGGAIRLRFLSWIFAALFFQDRRATFTCCGNQPMHREVTRSCARLPRDARLAVPAEIYATRRSASSAPRRFNGSRFSQRMNEVNFLQRRCLLRLGLASKPPAGREFLYAQQERGAAFYRLTPAMQKTSVPRRSQGDLSATSSHQSEGAGQFLEL